MHTTAVDASAVAVAALRAVGVPEEPARIQAGLLIDAELRGLPSHGLLRLPRLLRRIENGLAPPTATGRHSWAGESLLNVEADNDLGTVVASRALETLAAGMTSTALGAEAKGTLDSVNPRLGARCSTWPIRTRRTRAAR
jgi:L-2-hydroxycarboxylate dehydrogenase (NAD+)